MMNAMDKHLEAGKTLVGGDDQKRGRTTCKHAFASVRVRMPARMFIRFNVALLDGWFMMSS